jgi:tetratricopeptide (TPR) repeat protein
MSHTPTLNQPTDAPTASSSYPLSTASAADTSAAAEELAARLRAELAATTDKARQARLLFEIANLEERSGDEPAAARDYLSAYNADQSFREPLEGLVGLLERRRSLKNLGKLIDALERSASSPDEKVRALLMRATYQADVVEDVTAAMTSAQDATRVEGAPAAERASAWLTLEVLAGRTGDMTARESALAERTKFATQPAWRALLLLGRARAAANGGQIDDAVALLEEARSLGSSATWAVTSALEQLVREHAATRGQDEVRARAEAHANALDDIATLIEQALRDPARGDALGVPQWLRSTPRLVDASLNAADERRVLGQLDQAAATLDRALSHVAPASADETSIAEGALVDARIRIAEQTGDTALAAQLAERRLASEKDGALAAALAMRIAEHAAAQGDVARAFEALSRAVASDPGSLPARALQLDMLADGGDPGTFAGQLESFAEHLASDNARARAFLLAAYVWAIQARDVAGAKAALSQAGMYGIAPTFAARVARVLAGIAGDLGWYEEATKRLLAAGVDDQEAVSLYVELVRLRHARGDRDGEAKALREMSGTAKGGWLARILEAFLPSSSASAAEAGDRAAMSDHLAEGSTNTSDRARTALEELAAMEAQKDPELAHGLSIVAAARARAAGDIDSARRQLREVFSSDTSDPIVATMLADLEREAGDRTAAADIASTAAGATTDAELASALRFEAAFERWRGGDRAGAIREMEAMVGSAPEAAKIALAWAARGDNGESIDARRKAIELAADAGLVEERILALERFAVEVAGGDPDAAATALAVIDRTPEGDLGVASALARLAWSQGTADPSAIREATARIEARGPLAFTLALAEQTRIARESNDRDEFTRAARRWFEGGGGAPAALEWLAGATAVGDAKEEHQARLALASLLEGEARECMLASAALARARAEPGESPPLVAGNSAAVRLANLELAPPGSDPRRRRAALTELNGALGGDAEADAVPLSGWAALAAEDFDGARSAFEKTIDSRPGDLAAWEGLRVCAEMTGNRPLRARAAAELGARCKNASRGAAFWEEAALLWLELEDEARADEALEQSFLRDAGRAVAFDKLFRRVRARKDNDRLLGLITRRLEAADDPAEILKLFWEQSRVLRELGDQDAALRSLERVTELDPDHVGALALLGEINIRRGFFDDAAASLARLAMLESAPAKNRITAGVAAVDLYENKLARHDKALEVLLSLHHAKLSTLPVRERLARSAARTGAWNEATAMLEELMNERAEAAGRIEAARLAMTIHRDRLAHPQGAAAAIVKLLQESPADGEALDMLLETEHAAYVREPLLQNARRTLAESLASRPTDATTVRRLAKVAHALADDALYQAALGVLVALGAADSRSEQTLSHLVASKSRPPLIAIDAKMMRSLLAPGDEGPVADLFVLLGPTLVESFGPSLQSCGVGKRDKVDPRSGLALRNEIAAWAGAFGVHEFDLYVGGSDPLGAQGIPGEPPSLVLGTGHTAPLSPKARARIARELLAIVRGTTVVRLRDDITMAAVVVAACKVSEVPITHPPYAVLVEVERLLGRALARRTRKMLPDICRSIVSRGADARAWTKCALASLDRVAAVASGDPNVVLADMVGASKHSVPPSVSGNARAEAVLRFVLSPQYIELRRSLGLDGTDMP